MRLSHLHGDIEIALGHSLSLEQVAAMENVAEVLDALREARRALQAAGRTARRGFVLADEALRRVDAAASGREPVGLEPLRGRIEAALGRPLPADQLAAMGLVGPVLNGLKAAHDTLLMSDRRCGTGYRKALAALDRVDATAAADTAEGPPEDPDGQPSAPAP